MRGRLFSVAAGASAVLCAGVCVLWVLSYQHLDMAFPSFDRASGVAVWEGEAFGWEWEQFRLHGGARSRLQVSQRVPLWRLAGVAAALPAAWGWVNRHRLAWFLSHPRRAARRRRGRRGRCPACGYDLRATPARCPERKRVPSPRA